MNIRIKYTALSPISHIGEVASTGSYFQMISTSDGKVPVITGNAIRGTIRDAGAKHLLSKLNIKVDKEIFNVLFSGGNISGSMKLDVARALAVRDKFPLVSLLGGGLGTMMMGGKVLFGFAYPLCIETASMLEEDSNNISWHDLINEIEFTRTDDSKNELNSKYIKDLETIETTKKKTSEASTQMRFSVQYMATGTEFIQDIRFYDNVNDSELGAFYCALVEWFKMPKIGGMGSRGFGMLSAVVGNGKIILNPDGNITIEPQIQELMNKYNSLIETLQEDDFKILGGK